MSILDKLFRKKRSASAFGANKQTLKAGKAASVKRVRSMKSEGMSRREEDNRFETGPWYIGKTVGEIFEIRGVLGRGGMGIVYKAYDNATMRDVAVKVPLGKFVDDEGAKKHFTHEAEAWTDLIHPHIVHAFDVRDDQTADYRPAIFMDYCEGGNLADRLEQNGPLPIPEALDIAIQVCWAMAFAHEQGEEGYLHRDLKPENVLLDGEGKAMVSDFGLVKILDIEELQTEYGNGGKEAGLGASMREVGGTPKYMPPEQWRGRAEKRSDIYAFGVMLYELFCGTLPFTADNPADLRKAHESVPPPEPQKCNAKVSTELAALMQSCLAKKTSDRPKDFDEAVVALSQIYGQITGSAYSSWRQKPKAVYFSREDTNARAYSAVRLGVGCQRRGDLDDAMRNYKFAKDLFKEIGNRHGVQASLCDQASILRSWGKQEQAMRLLKEQEEICQAARLFDGLQASLGNQAVILLDWGRRKEAMRIYQAMANLCREQENEDGLAKVLNAQALILVSWERSEDAMQLLGRAAMLYEELGDQMGQQTILGSKALVLEAKGELNEAVELFDRKENICHQLGYNEGCAISLAEQAALLLKLNKPNDALPQAEEAYRLAYNHNLTLLASQVKHILEMCQHGGEIATEAVEKKIEELDLVSGASIRFVVGGDANSPHHRAAVKALRKQGGEVISDK